MEAHKISDEDLKEVTREHKRIHKNCDSDNMRAESFNFEGGVNSIATAIEIRIDGN